MKTFSDNKGEIWTLSLTLQKTRKMREALGLDLLAPNHYLQILNSLTDQMAFVFLLCEEKATAMKVDADQFEERLYDTPQRDGVSTEASLAFIQETEVFFQRLGQKALAGIARKSIESIKSGRAKIQEMFASGQYDSLLQKAQDEMDSFLQKTLDDVDAISPKKDGNGSSNSQPSQESTGSL
tara:strand:- start:15660 stop:16205 length:546 start_codon:yes stop_codon:yes gene_type:complete